jgi:hypothetical protein
MGPKIVCSQTCVPTFVDETWRCSNSASRAWVKHLTDAPCHFQPQ